jgi:sugar phosphate isomerase/epimerase
MNIPRNPFLTGVSTWALHPLIGHVEPGRPGTPDSLIFQPSPRIMSLEDAITAAAEHGYTMLELCHFHIDNPTDDRLEQLRQHLEKTGVRLWSLLIDDGDITHETDNATHIAWIAMWIDRASRLGADTVRVIGGHATPDTSSRARCRAAFQTLSMEAFVRGVRVRTENWFPLLCNPTELNDCIRALQGAVGLTFDFGNWGGDDKYTQLAAIAHHAEGCHAKCSYDGPTPDEADFETCIRLLKDVGYPGPFTLVHAPGESVWDALAYQRSVIERVYSETAD